MKDWQNGHKYECKLFAQHWKDNDSRSSLNIDFWRFVLRIHFISKFHPSLLAKKCVDHLGNELSFNNLIDHCNEMSPLNKSNFSLLVKDFVNMGIEFEEKQLISIFAKVYYNIVTGISD